MGLTGKIGNLIEALFLRHWSEALLVSWFISPCALYLLAVLLESRQPPIWQNFKAFLPGDLFLGLALAWAVNLAKQLPEHGWWQSIWWPRLACLLCLVFALAMIFCFDGPRYPLAARISPTKLWHDIVAYWLWATTLMTVIVPVIFYTPWSRAKGWLLVNLAVYGLGIICDVIWPPDLTLLHTRWDLSRWLQS